MKRQFVREATACVLVLATVFAGCTKSRKEYANLAQAGTTYSAAIDNLLVATEKIAIDANSERLLQDDALLNLTEAQYKALSDEDKKLIRTARQLRQHVELLARYFGLLLELGTSDAPDRAQKAIGDDSTGLIGNLNAVSSQLRGSGLVPANIASASGPITNFVVSSMVRKALKDELMRRKDTIRNELLLQEELLKVLSSRITHDLTITQNTLEDRLVAQPLLSTTPISNPDGWIGSRRTVLTMSATADQLRVASEDVKKLREAFEDFTSGKLTLARVDSLLTDFQALLSITEKLRN
jgi:hypothetical protein